METRPLVVVTDDDDDTREMYEACLGLSGFDVELALDGEDAWVKTLALLPDIVVTDLTLRNVDGYDLCHRIRENPRTANIPVIAVTGRAGQFVDDNIRAAGFSAALLKPVIPQVLVEQMRQAIAGARALRARSEEVRSRAENQRTRANRLLSKSERLRAIIEKKK